MAIDITAIRFGADKLDFSETRKAKRTDWLLAFGKGHGADAGATGKNNRKYVIALVMPADRYVVTVNGSPVLANEKSILLSDSAKGDNNIAVAHNGATLRGFFNLIDAKEFADDLERGMVKAGK